jgi:hypothetical protein
VAYLRGQVADLQAKQQSLERLVSEQAGKLEDLALGLEQAEPTATLMVDFRPATEDQRQRIAALQKEMWAIVREIGPNPASQGGVNK